MTDVAPKKRRDWKPAFLEALHNSANVRAACLAAGVTRTHAYRTRLQNAVFAAAWEQAEQEAVDTLEAVAWTRARTVSDTLLIFLLKAHRPAKYRETTRHELTGPDGGPIKHVTQSELDRDIDALMAEMAHREKAGLAGSPTREAGLVPLDTPLPVREATEVPST